MFKFLDSLSDEEVLKFLDWRFGEDEPIWEECSEEEYNQECSEQYKRLNCLNPGKPLPSLDEIVDWFINKQYKKEPVYKEWKGGILSLLKLQEEKGPDCYKYYKKVGSKRIVLLGNELMEYLQNRNIKTKQL